jgi:hypothetical protein
MINYMWEQGITEYFDIFLERLIKKHEESEVTISGIRPKFRTLDLPNTGVIITRPRHTVGILYFIRLPQDAA